MPRQKITEFDAMSIQQLLSQLQRYDPDAIEIERRDMRQLAIAEMEATQKKMDAARKDRPTLTGRMLAALGMGRQYQQGGRAQPLESDDPPPPVRSPNQRKHGVAHKRSKTKRKVKA